MPKPVRYLDRLRGRSAIVTGAGSQGNGIGIGRAISILFAGEGARVCLVDRHRQRIESTAAMIASEGGECMVCVANVTSSVDCAEIAARAVDQFGGIDIVVNNVGIAAKAATLEELTESEWRSVMDTNLSGVFLMSKAAMPHLLGRAGASIVNIASIAGERAHGAAAYGTSKAALIAFTRELAVIYGRAGIRANAIAPGHVFTPLSRRRDRCRCPPHSPRYCTPLDRGRRVGHSGRFPISCQAARRASSRELVSTWMAALRRSHPSRHT
jgi:NAD(P)-dependent dehydrogenase (short-subunit alcohol dehydrogenase family)